MRTNYSNQLSVLELCGRSTRGRHLEGLYFRCYYAVYISGLSVAVLNARSGNLLAAYGGTVVSRYYLPRSLSADDPAQRKYTRRRTFLLVRAGHFAATFETTYFY